MTHERGTDGVRSKPFTERSLWCSFVGGPIAGQSRIFPGGDHAIVPAYCDDGLVRNAEYAYEQVVEYGVLIEWKAIFCAYSR
jgi:hypothetical protein